MSGYTECGCRDCMEIAISTGDEPELCHECEEAGCEAGADSECCAPGAYGADEECGS